MQKELHLLLGRMGHDVELLTRDDRRYYLGTLEGHEVIATQCGIGKVNAALGADSAIREFHPDLVINTGVAGGVGSEGVKVLDVVVADHVAYHDVWCGPGTEWGEASGYPLLMPAALEMLAPGTVEGIEAAKVGLICSGDIFVSRPEEVALIRGHFPQVKAVDMESAAIMQTCMRRKVPCMVVRVISDTPGGEDNIAQYEQFWDDAPRESMDALAAILKGLPATK